MLDEDNPFQFDTVLTTDNICNLLNERGLLIKAVNQCRKIVVYGPRNCGKTSLIQSEIIPYFRKKYKKPFILNVDLMEVKSLEAISSRIQKAFEIAFAESFPAEKLLDSAKKFLLGMRPNVEFDAVTGMPSVSFSTANKKELIEFDRLFKTIRESIAPKIPTLIIMDEFQDIVFVPEAQGLIRDSLQYFNKLPIVLLGSKRHILTQIFAVPDAPLAGFGEDLEFGTISYQEYEKYIASRFKRRKLTIDGETCNKLQDLLYRSPEPINMVCSEIYNNSYNEQITWEKVVKALYNTIAKKRSRYEAYLANFSEKEEALLVALRKAEPLKKPTSTEFLRTVKLSNRSITQMLKYFYDHSIVDKTEEGYRIADPLLGFYIGRYR